MVCTRTYACSRKRSETRRGRGILLSASTKLRVQVLGGGGDGGRGATKLRIHDTTAAVRPGPQGPMHMEGEGVHWV